MNYILAYDIGTTGLKTCVFEVDKTINIIARSTRGYPLYILPNGGAEQSGDDWFQAMIDTTKEIFSNLKITPSQICGISFCSQSQGLILVDKDGVPVHRPMSYMDQRSKEEVKKGIGYGLQIAGANIFKLIPSLIITGAVSSSVKDPLWKCKWVEHNEPENFKRAYKWLDVKDYLIHRITGEFTMTEDDAFATLLYDSKKNCFSKKMCKMFDVDINLFPKVIKSTDLAGKLTKKAALELGLVEGIPVFGGGGDNSLIGIGAGCVDVGDTHIYSGTSGWVSTLTSKRMVDTNAMIAAITSAERGKYNYFAEMETAGKCLEWVKDHLALDEIGVYIEKRKIVDEYEPRYTSLYDYLTQVIETVPAGSNGVIFTPWLHGNRCPFEDPNATGTFFGIKLETGKTEMIRSVLEGIFYHIRWMLECEENKTKTSERIRFVGGGALSEISCQIVSDITGRVIETVDHPQNVGVVGAAACVAVGLGLIPSLEKVKEMIPVKKTFYPNKENHEVYNKYFKIFKQIYKANKKNYKMIAEGK